MSIFSELNDPTLALAATVLFAILAFYSQQPCVKYPLADACVDGVFTPVQEMETSEAAKILYLYGNGKKY